MNKSFLGLCLFAISLSTNAQKLQNTTNIPVQLNDEISSKTTPDSYQGAIVAVDIKDKAGNVLVKQGTPVLTNVVSQKARGVGKPGTLELEFVSTKAVDGTIIRLTGKTSKEGKDYKGKVLGLGLGLGLTIVWPMLFYLCKKGEQAVIPAGTILNNIYTVGEYDITL